MKKQSPPTTHTEAIEMITPLDPINADKFTIEKKLIAWQRLNEFFKLLLPKE